MRRRFFIDAFENDRAHMRGDDAHHLARVLRAEPGQLYELSDSSSVWLAKIESAARDHIEFSLVEQLPAAAPKLVTALLLSIVKFDRFEWALEKATELGVAEIVPLAATRSEKSLVAAAAKRSQRWQRILMESAQQSRRLRAPILHPAQPPAAAFRFSPSSPLFSVSSSSSVPSVLNVSCLKIFLSESKDAPSLRVVAESAPQASPAILAIGPEGGWTDSERASALAAGFSEASLGSLILRTETAVAAALASLNYALGG